MPSSARKRSRASINEDESQPDTKRQRQVAGNNGGGETIMNSITKGVANYIGWSVRGKEKENGGEEDEPVMEELEQDGDELADTPPPEKKTPTSKDKRRDVWDPPSSDGEEIETQGQQRRSVRKLGYGRSSMAATPRHDHLEASTKRNSSIKSGKTIGVSVSTPKDTTAPSKSKVSTRKTRDNMAADELANEVTPQDGKGEAATPVRVNRDKLGSTSTVSKAAQTSDAKLSPSKLQHRSPGRPSKSTLLKNAKQLARQGRRANMSVAGEDLSDAEEEASVIKELDWTGRKAEVVDQEEGIAPRSEIRSSGRKRGRPKKYREDLSDSIIPTPKSILTPKKGRPKGPRKSVLFEPDTEINLGFKDIPTNSPVEPVLKPTTHQQVLHTKPELTTTVVRDSKTSIAVATAGVHSTESGSEEDPDTACEMCLKRNSTSKNPIMLCDGCNAGYHIKCYGLSGVPETDWFCKNCQLDRDGLLPEIEPQYLAVSTDLPDIDGFEEHLRCMQHVVLEKLTGQRKVELRGFEEEMQKVHQVVEQTVVAGEGNSMLVIGARGCGKTTLVESVISNLSEHRESFHVIRLNGFFHTDDKLALREIWRQLGREMDIEDDHTSTNHADTLATLLALLSHPSETAQLGNNQTAKSVIFILDEFDLFTTHPRQTLLYNLFDIAQAKKAPIVVLGLTTKVDVVESLEKRVKSRFSHRYVHLSLPRSIPTFWEICKQGLLASVEELDALDLKAEHAGKDQFVSFWQAMIEDLYSKDAAFKSVIQLEFYRSKSVPAFFTSCVLPMARLSTRNPILTGKSCIQASLSCLAPDSKLQILQGLSELELALLIAAARLDIILDTDTCNFAMAYDEYSSITSRHKIQTSSTGVTALGASAKVWGRDVSLAAWEKLVQYEILVPAGIGGAGRDFGAAGRMWRVDVGLEEIPGSVEGLSTVMTRWCREI